MLVAPGGAEQVPWGRAAAGSDPLCAAMLLGPGRARGARGHRRCPARPWGCSCDRGQVGDRDGDCPQPLRGGVLSRLLAVRLFI